MNDDRELQQERDNDLIRCMAYRTNDLRGYFREWISNEIKDLQPKMDMLTTACSGQEISKELQLKHKRLREINTSELSEHLNYVGENCNAFKDGATSDLVKDMFQLDDGIHYLRDLVRELRDIRQLVYRLWEAEDRE